MTGDGLFFTGVVYKRNLDLFAQQATRDQLKIQREELELRKQEAAERRKKLRESGKVQPKDYSLDNLDPFLAEQFQLQVNDYTNFVKENAFDIKDSNELTTEQLRLEGDLAINSNKYKSISTDLSALNSVAIGQNKGNLRLAEDGETYLYQYNYQKIQEEVRSGNMTLDQALEAYPIDPESMVKSSEFVPFYQALIDADDANPRKMYEQGEYNMTGISDDQKADTTSQIASKLKVNINNNHNDNNAAQVYNNEMVEGPDGSRISGKEAFFLEAYVDPNTDVKGGITSPSQDLMDQLDPKSENFNRELSDQYAEYLAGKIAERGYRDKKDRRSSKVSGETISERKKRESEEAQNQYNIDTYNEIKDKATTEDLGYQVHEDKFIGAENPQNNKVDVKVDDLLGNVTEKMQETADIARTESNGMINMVVVGVTLDGSGQVVARVKHTDSGAEAYIPWNKVASKQIYDALRPEGKNLVDYRQPQTQTSQPSEGSDNSNDRSSVL
jgi:hypothetical protein